MTTDPLTDAAKAEIAAAFAIVRGDQTRKMLREIHKHTTTPPTPPGPTPPTPPGPTPPTPPAPPPPTPPAPPPPTPPTPPNDPPKRTSKYWGDLE